MYFENVEILADIRCDMEDDELRKQAVAALIKDAKRGAERAKDMGVNGWLKPKVSSTNKRFLANTLQSTLTSDFKKKKTREKAVQPKLQSETDGRSRSRSPVFDHKLADKRRAKRRDEDSNCHNNSSEKSQ